MKLPLYLCYYFVLTKSNAQQNENSAINPNAGCMVL